MLEDKLISVILPVYNGERYLRESIESVLNQSHKNLELIIVNDASTDNTASIIDSFAQKDNRIKVITNQQNLKLPSSLNVGFEHASGSCYTWTSHDNYFLPNALESLLSALYDADDTAMVYAGYYRIDSEGKKTEITSPPPPEQIAQGNPCGACFLYRASAAKKAGKYDETLFLAEDYEYWIRLSKTGSLQPVQEVLYCYRVHGDTLTATRMSEIVAQTHRVYEKHFSYLLKTMRTDEEKKTFLHHFVEWTPAPLKKRPFVRHVMNILPTG